MGANKIKEYIIISGLYLEDSNRGTAALGYGAFSFLKEKGYIKCGQEILSVRPIRNFLRKGNRGVKTLDITIGDTCWKHKTLNVFIGEIAILKRFGILLPFTSFGRYMRRAKMVAAINGGDGFSDIYNTQSFLERLTETEIAMALNIPVIQLPQTFGPFKEETNMKIAERILQYSSKVYVRDNKFVKELERMGVEYEMTQDLSAFMPPQPWNIEIKPNAIGLNVSGLVYSNNFRTLAGQFEYYPDLINELIRHFQQKGYPVYLIPHSYRFGNPEENNDDMVACQMAYEHLMDKTNVYFVDNNLNSPQVKYVISKMSFFIGTRMHANFAAIYTKVPLFGLAYSYKFEGAFNANGLNGIKQTAMINNIEKKDIPSIIGKIESFYQEQK